MTPTMNLIASWITTPSQWKTSKVTNNLWKKGNSSRYQTTYISWFPNVSPPLHSIFLLTDLLLEPFFIPKNPTFQCFTLRGSPLVRRIGSFYNVVLPYGARGLKGETKESSVGSPWNGTATSNVGFVLLSLFPTGSLQIYILKGRKTPMERR